MDRNFYAGNFMSVTPAVRTTGSTLRSLCILGAAAVAFSLAGCAGKPAITKPIEPAQGGKHFTSLEMKEGEHVRDVNQDTRQALKGASVNMLIEQAKKDEVGRAAAGDKDIHRMTVTYKVTAYDPGTAWMRAFLAFAGLGKSVMKTEVTFSDGAKTLGRIEIETTVTQNDLLSTLDQQHSNLLWGQVWTFFTDNFYHPYQKS